MLMIIGCTLPSVMPSSTASAPIAHALGASG
jgi:hypothetical protein